MELGQTSQIKKSKDGTKSKIVYASGIVQGIVLVTFPAASTIFMARGGYNLSSTQYGTLFIPQVITAIITSLLGTGLARRFSIKVVYLLGLSSGLVAMALLVLSQFSSHSLAYPLLLIATAFVGAGFGLTVPAINTLTSAFHQSSIDSSVLVLNALLGLGTALAPVFVAIFVGLGFWWGLPILSAILLAILLTISLKLDLNTGSEKENQNHSKTKVGIPKRFWLYAAFAVVYGISETMNGNWAQLSMVHLGASTTMAAIALTTFWAMVTTGRIIFAALHKLIPPPWTYRLLPFVVAVAFFIISTLQLHSVVMGIVVFGLAGLGCSALLPLTISFGQEQEPQISSSIAGGVIAFYQLGYGIAAFGVGPIQAMGISLVQIFKISSLIAISMGILSFLLARKSTTPPTLHPRISLEKNAASS